MKIIRRTMSAYDIVQISLFSAFISVCSIITINIGIVPINFALVAIFITGYLLDSFKSFFSVLVYILLGCVGIPVFAGFKGGFSVILGPTGGFILSYLFVVLIVGLGAKYFKKRMTIMCLFMGLGLIVCYLFGTLWFSINLKTEFVKAFSVCVLPFIPFDIGKIFIALLLGKKIVRVNFN